MFDRSVSFPDRFSVKDINAIDNPETHQLSHFATENVCNGVYNKDAHGCQNDECPDLMGCPIGAFDFGNEDIQHTPKYHPDIDTPSLSPTKYFTQSSQFTFSRIFSNSEMFSSSKMFFNSNAFDDSNCFSKSKSFVRSSNFILPPNINKKDKSITKGALAGIIIGAVAGAAVIAVVVFFFVRRKFNLIPTSDPGVLETFETSITTKNNLNEMMDQDDPFANEFK